VEDDQACYGDAEPHVHWHLFPRYDTLPDHRRNPWLHCDEFRAHQIDTASAQGWRPKCGGDYRKS